MLNASVRLARSITRAGSKQTYYTARQLVDKDLVDDFFRAYAYFRWADNVVDAPSSSNHERISFIQRQRALIEGLYRHEQPGLLTPEEQLAAELIGHDTEEESGLQSFIHNLLAIIEFDAYRKGQLISEEKLTWYTKSLSEGVTEGLQYFIGHNHPYPATRARYHAAHAAHITHLLRDMVIDISNGFINIPQEYLETYCINPADQSSSSFRAWVQGQVEQARHYFREGKAYLNELEVLRCKLAGYWYCARFEGVLDAIEDDGYVLRAEYNDKDKLWSWLKMAKIGVAVILRHITHEVFGWPDKTRVEIAQKAD